MRGDTRDSSDLTLEYWEGRAKDCYARGKLEAALACGEKVRELFPCSRNAPVGRAFILIFLGWERKTALEKAMSERRPGQGARRG